MMPYTDQEKEELADANTPAEISLVSEDVTDTVDEEVVEKFSAELEEDEHLGVIIDFNLYQKLLASPTKLTTLTTPVHISFKIPESLILPDEETAVRAYRVLRLHDDTVEELDTSMDENKVTSFSTDKFSYYAVTYTDIVYAPATPDATDDGLLVPDTSVLLAPDTGEMATTLSSAKTCAIASVIMGIISAIVALFAITRLRNLKVRLKNSQK